MIKQKIELEKLLQKGQVDCNVMDHMLFMTTKYSIPTKRFEAEHISIRSYCYLPERVHLPLRIDMTVKIDAPGMYLLLGNGHINFGTLVSDNRRLDDIVSPSRKTMFFHNAIRMNEFNDISVLYDKKEMQIIINGEERYYSKKERYMKAPEFEAMNQEGVELKFACDKLVTMCIKSITITEYQDTCGIVPSGFELPIAITQNGNLIKGEKPTFESCILRLPIDIQSEIQKLDEYLRTLKPLKFKRQIEKNGNKISYVASDYGVSYAIYLSNELFDHSLQWYLITGGKPETWHRKADRMEDTLNFFLQTSPEYAKRMISSFEDCVGCYQNCLAKTQYQMEGKRKTVCHGKLKFKMSVEGLRDARTFIDGINQL